MEQTFLNIIVNGRKPHHWSKYPDEFDSHEFKADIIKEAGAEKIREKVGKNPDIGIDKNNKIFFKGQGPNKGTTCKTNIDADAYFAPLELSEGWKFVGKSVKPDHRERARRAWPMLVCAAKHGRVFTYKELCNLMEIHHRPAAWFLGEIQDYCRAHHLPALQCIVVNAITRKPGAGYALPLTDDAYIAERDRVFKWDWPHQVPSDF